MNKEEQRLLTMLKDNKISESDYQMLSSALNKKSLCTVINDSLLVNPFQKIAGFNALLIGLVLAVLMSLVGVYANVFFDASLGFIIPQGIKTALKPNFFLLLYQNIVAIFVTSTLFLISALIFRQKRIRVIDFYGTVAMARFPLFISLIFIILQQLIDPKLYHEDISKGIELHFSLLSTVSYLLFLSCFIWQIMTYFSALKVSSGFEGKRLWTCFIICMVLAESVSMALTRYFLYV